MQETNELEEKKAQQAAIRKAGTISLQGKDYLQVAYRIKMMRDEHANWGIRTAFETHRFAEQDMLVCRATIHDDNGLPLATAIKTVTAGGKGPAGKYPLEMAETGAIGRALASCGFGTLSGDFDESDQIADAPVTRKW